MKCVRFMSFENKQLQIRSESVSDVPTRSFFVYTNPRILTTVFARFPEPTIRLAAAGESFWFYDDRSAISCLWSLGMQLARKFFQEVHQGAG